ncbi:MAG: SufS family cysteine desulfurase [Propionibacteriaceae bacterium]|nr:SufS family cysteine desulfurase [Propionibacteriaceae bacterium]
MSTTDRHPGTPGLPIGPDDLARLASQVYAESTPLQVSSGPGTPGTVPSVPAGGAALVSAPPLLQSHVDKLGHPEPSPVSQVWVASAPVAPRGSLPSTGSVSGLAPLAAEALGQAAPISPHAPQWDAPLLGLPGADTPPYTVPTAPRGSAPTSGAGTSLAENPTDPAGSARLGPPVWLGAADRTPVLPGLDRLLAPWGATEPEPEEFFALGDPDRSGGLPPSALTESAEFDVHTVRKDFPILAEQVNGHPLIWFDNAATTQKPQAVIDRLAHFYAHENSNIHRAAHELAARATDAYEDARDTVRDFLGAGRSEEIVFVRGATEAINLVAQSWGRANLRAGDEILITHLEHHANIVPWQIVARETGAVIKVAPVDDAGNLLLDEFTRLLNSRTRLVSATAVANAIGTVTPVEPIVTLAHRVGARVLIDGAQSVPHLAVDLRQLDPDFFVFSGHKVFGPTGIGALYIAERVWDETPAWQGGGNMIADVTIERSIYQPPPNKYEAGTGNIADAVGLAAALRYVADIGIQRINAYEHSLLEYATPRLAAIPRVRLVGTADSKASVLSFLLAGHDPEEVGKALNQRGIAVRAGHHCAQPILRRLGVEKTVRPSFAFYNTVEEIDVFLAAVNDLSERSTTV